MTVATLDRQMEPAPQTADRPYVEFVGLQKSYDGTSLVVRDLNLSVRRGEFLTLLGPSGSGKTTTLMMLAGFEAPTDGRIFLDGASIEDLPPHKRDIGMVFQNYALFPHMTVRQNIAFPLSVRRTPVPRSRTGSHARCRRSGCRGWRTAARHSSPAGSSSAWHWPVRWCSSPSSC